MITGFAAKGKETGDKMFDYMGCLYPEGVISSDKNLLFDHEQIGQIYYLGYVDEEWKVLEPKIKDLVSNIESGKQPQTSPLLNQPQIMSTDDLFN